MPTHAEAASPSRTGGHVCSSGCPFDQQGDRFACRISGCVHVCDESCDRVELCNGLHVCALTRRCHSGVREETRRNRTVNGQRTNNKDKFFRAALNVICKVTLKTLDTPSIESLASRCLRLYSLVLEHGDKVCVTSKPEYVALSMLYLLKDGLKESNVEIIPKLGELTDILPSLCEIHKFQPLLRDDRVRKRTYTRTTRQLVAALRNIVIS